MHILPEVLLKEGNVCHSNSGHHIVLKKGDDGKLYSKYVQLACMVLGLVAPMGLTFLQDE